MVSNLIVWCIHAIIVLLIVIGISTFIHTKNSNRKDLRDDDKNEGV